MRISSVDSYFEQEWSSRNDAKELFAAREHCLDHFLDSIQRGIDFLALDNTNSQLWEHAVYRRLAELFGYHVQIVQVACAGSGALEEFARRNSHNVPLASIQEMYNRWEVDPSALTVHIHGSQLKSYVRTPSRSSCLSVLLSYLLSSNQRLFPRQFF